MKIYGISIVQGHHHIKVTYLIMKFLSVNRWTFFLTMIMWAIFLIPFLLTMKILTKCFSNQPVWYRSWDNKNCRWNMDKNRAFSIMGKFSVEDFVQTQIETEWNFGGAYGVPQIVTHSWRKAILKTRSGKVGWIMKERKEVLNYALTFPDTYLDTPFHDPNWACFIA